MKKSFKCLIFSVLFAVMFGIVAFADDFTYVINDLNMDNYWYKTGKTQEKVYSVAGKIISANNLTKRVPLVVINRTNEVNANSNMFYKNITIYTGILRHISNDDELAFILGHEMAHSIEAYGGPVKYLATMWNAKSYEMKSDLKAIDYMVKAGYDPISAIIIGNKVFDEPMWDWGFFAAHPKGSKRLVSMYKYIYKKYPQYLNSPKTNSPYFKNFEVSFADELKGFRHKEDIRQQKRIEKTGEL